MPITRTVGRGSCRATLHDDETVRVLVTVPARSLTANPRAGGLEAVVQMDPHDVRDLYDTLRAFLAGEDDDPAAWRTSRAAST